MQADQVEMRGALERLADHDGGRRLLQLALRSIESGDQELVSGCWTRKGDAGCLFQHAYWQGVSDGVFEADGHARAWVSGVAGPQAYHCVIDVIAAFDRLARAEYAVEQRWFGPPELDRERWRTAVAGLLVEVLGRDGDRTPPEAQPMLSV
jgi:hypothetical protein